MTVIRWTVGLLGLILLVGVSAEIAGGSLSYALTEGWGRGGSRVITGHETVRTGTGLLFAFGSFGLMGLGAVAFALKPRLFANPTLMWTLLAVILLCFVGLRVSN